MSLRGLLPLLACALALAGAPPCAPAAAQRLPDPRFAPAAALNAVRPPTVAADSDRAVSWGEVGLGAALGGLVGAGVGGFVGYHLGGGKRLCGDDNCGFYGGILGVLIGEPVGMGLGAHLFDSRRGSFALDALGAAATGYLLAYAAETSDQEGLLPLAGIIQVAMTVGIERASAEARRRRAGR